MHVLFGLEGFVLELHGLHLQRILKGTLAIVYLYPFLQLNLRVQDVGPLRLIRKHRLFFRALRII